jgi:hypothetical protein
MATCRTLDPAFLDRHDQDHVGPKVPRSGGGLQDLPDLQHGVALGKLHLQDVLDCMDALRASPCFSTYLTSPACTPVGAYECGTKP